MGTYINRGNMGFARARQGEYIDKSLLISYINQTINTEKNLTCVSRPRRFGKSMAAKMLYAYYDKSCDSRKLFEDLKVAHPNNEVNKNPQTAFETHLNKYPTIYIDVTDFISLYHNSDDIIKILVKEVKEDILEAYPDIHVKSEADLLKVMLTIAEHTGEQFILIIDEWDALCRELAEKPELMDEYVRLLRSLFKSSNAERVFAAVYMTGILPIKQYGTQSALNNFQPYSMISPEPIGAFFGFTREEVKSLCSKYNMSYPDMEKWYDGYDMGSAGHVFNPTSVMMALNKRQLDNYWSQTSSFKSLRNLINLNFEGVKETIMTLLQDETASIVALRYGDDGGKLESCDELFSLLVHYGYFTFNPINREIAIPNQEIRTELLNVVRTGNRKELVKLIEDSDTLLAATLAMDEEYVSKALDELHSQYTTPRFYNNEQALRGLIRYAFIAATGDYVPFEELPTGKGFADVAFVPSRSNGKPVILVELKYNETTDTAIKQIKERRYPEKLLQFSDNLLLVGVSYDKKTKKHVCTIEKADIHAH